MEPFARQCTSNLRMWETRSAELLVTAAPIPPPTAPVSPSRLPEDFFTAFPMTIPTHLVTRKEQAEAFGTYHPFEGSGSSSDSSSYDYSYPRSETQNLQTTSSTHPSSSPLISPLESVGPSPREQYIPHHQRPSSAGSSSSFASEATTTTIRAAYHAGVRKKTSINRSSWNANPWVSAPPPPSPQVSKLGFVNFVAKDS